MDFSIKAIEAILQSPDSFPHDTFGFTKPKPFSRSIDLGHTGDALEYKADTPNEYMQAFNKAIKEYNNGRALQRLKKIKVEELILDDQGRRQEKTRRAFQKNQQMYPQLFQKVWDAVLPDLSQASIDLDTTTIAKSLWLEGKLPNQGRFIRIIKNQYEDTGSKVLNVYEKCLDELKRTYMKALTEEQRTIIRDQQETYLRNVKEQTDYQTASAILESLTYKNPDEASVEISEADANKAERLFETPYNKIRHEIWEKIAKDGQKSLASYEIKEIPYNTNIDIIGVWQYLQEHKKEIQEFLYKKEEIPDYDMKDLLQELLRPGQELAGQYNPEKEKLIKPLTLANSLWNIGELMPTQVKFIKEKLEADSSSVNIEEAAVNTGEKTLNILAACLKEANKRAQTPDDKLTTGELDALMENYTEYLGSFLLEKKEGKDNPLIKSHADYIEKYDKDHPSIWANVTNIWNAFFQSDKKGNYSAEIVQKGKGPQDKLVENKPAVNWSEEEVTPVNTTLISPLPEFQKVSSQKSEAGKTAGLAGAQQEIQGKPDDNEQRTAPVPIVYNTRGSDLNAGKENDQNTAPVPVVYTLKENQSFAQVKTTPRENPDIEMIPQKNVQAPIEMINNAEEYI